MIKYVSGLEDIVLLNKINGGNCSGIFEFGDDRLFKLFDEDYRDLSDPINVEFYDVIRYLSSLEGMPHIVRGKDIYRSRDELFGYSMDRLVAENFRNVSSTVEVDRIFSGFKVLSDDVRSLADSFVKTEDIGGDNIMFNDSGMYLLDLDLSLVDKRYIPDELYERCMNSLLCAVRQKVIGDSRFDDMVKNDEYFSYLMRLKNDCSEALGKEVVTISDMHNGYSKIKNRI